MSNPSEETSGFPALHNDTHHCLLLHRSDGLADGLPYHPIQKKILNTGSTSNSLWKGQNDGRRDELGCSSVHVMSFNLVSMMSSTTLATHSPCWSNHFSNPRPGPCMDWCNASSLAQHLATCTFASTTFSLDWLPSGNLADRPVEPRERNTQLAQHGAQCVKPNRCRRQSS